MEYKLIIKANSFKEFLYIFDKNEILKELEFADTCYPLSGYIDETILHGKNIIREILEFNYDFIGLVFFNAKIGNLNIDYISEKDVYRVSGLDYEVRKIEGRIIELNSYLDSYSYSIKKY